ILIAPSPTAGPTPGNLWFAPLRSAKHAASNVSAEPGLAPVHSASTDSSTRSAPTAATRLTTAQGLVKWPSRLRLPAYQTRSRTCSRPHTRFFRKCLDKRHDYTVTFPFPSCLSLVFF